MDIRQIMKQAKSMQDRMRHMQDDLGHVQVEGQSGGGLVKVVMNCRREMHKIEIAPELLTSDDKETLEDLIVAAVNMAVQNADSKMAEETQKMMQDFGLPTDFQLPDDL